MALPISDAVICGEIDNRTRNSVHGWIRLRGLEYPLLLHLTGNCCEDLIGSCLRFEATQTTATTTVTSDIHRLAPRQVGPLATATAIGRIQVAGFSADEFIQYSVLGEPLPRRWKQCFFLEWYSQNGRVIVELLDAKLTSIKAPSFNIDAELEEPEPVDRGAADEDDDPFGLFPDDLESTLAHDLGFDDSESDPFANDDCDNDSSLAGEDTPLRTIFDPPLRLYPANQLNNGQIEESLQVVLARLARHGVALDMCEHFSARQAYRLLLERVLPDESIPTGLVESGFVQHYSTHEFCAVCLEHLAMGDTERETPSDEEG